MVVRADGENVALLRTDERVRTTRSRVSDHYPGHGNVRQRKVCERRRNVPVRRSIRHAVAELQLPAVVAALQLEPDQNFFRVGSHGVNKEGGVLGEGAGQGSWQAGQKHSALGMTSVSAGGSLRGAEGGGAKSAGSKGPWQGEMSFMRDKGARKPGLGKRRQALRLQSEVRQRGCGARAVSGLGERVRSERESVCVCLAHAHT